MPPPEDDATKPLREEIARLEDQLWEQQSRLSKVYADLTIRNEKLREREAELEQLNKGLEQKVKEQLEQLERSHKLRRYLSPEVANRVLESDAADLKTHKRVVTVLFADIESFDELMGDMESEELVEVLSQYHRDMVEVLFRNGGTLDKFFGARIFCFFGDPVPQEDHALRAVRTALEMRTLVRNTRQWFAGAEGTDLQVGIHTGYATVGNVGSEARVEYTAIGKNVAVAAALLEQAKPGQVLISARTHEAVRDLFEVEPLSVSLRGTSRPTGVFNVIAERSIATGPTVVASTMTQLAPSPTISGAVGKRMGPYLVEAVLGAGGMGVVYKALDDRLQRPVALKVLPAELSRDETFVARFKREARALASLNSPHIAQIYYISDQEVPPFFAMELIDGPTLRKVLAQQGKLPLRRSLDIATQMAKGLAAAAEQGVIHRDVKPDNVMLNAKGVVKLTDFGLVKKAGGEASLTTRGVVVGTPLYMSPEQAEGLDVDLRSDIYSLGATLWHMITGEPPFRGESALSIMRRHAEQPLPPLAALKGALSADVYALLARMMAKRPADRFPDYPTLLAALDAC